MVLSFVKLSRFRFFFFFFQAEDGIRDHCVTGVQTCALPISSTSAASATIITEDLEVAEAADVEEQVISLRQKFGGNGPHRQFSALADEYLRRSEERRVGKECRSRWSPYH